MVARRHSEPFCTLPRCCQRRTRHRCPSSLSISVSATCAPLATLAGFLSLRKLVPSLSRPEDGVRSRCGGEKTTPAVPGRPRPGRNCSNIKEFRHWFFCLRGSNPAQERIAHESACGQTASGNGSTMALPRSRVQSPATATDLGQTPALGIKRLRGLAYGLNKMPPPMGGRQGPVRGLKRQGRRPISRRRLLACASAERAWQARCYCRSGWARAPS